jgi:hypothetical protein
MPFHFLLRDVDAIAPWGSPERPSLSWFGLSDGWYWIDVADQQVFRAAESATGGEPPYVDYPVVRLWEDVLDLLPVALEPVPPRIAAWLRTPDRFLAAAAAAEALASEGDDAGYEAFCAGLQFWHARRLDSGHLRAAPQLWLWREADTLHLVARSRPRESGESTLWHPVHAEHALPIDTFLAEVRAFDRSFLSAMGARVHELRARGGRRGVDIDLELLLREQADRSEWLDRALARVGHQPTDWSAALALLAGWSDS